MNTLKKIFHLSFAGLTLALLSLMTFHPAIAQSSNYSLRFYGHGVSDIDRVKIAIDPHVPANVGNDFTIEFWLKALAAENTSPSCAPGDVNWIYGNVVLDRDIYGEGDYGDYGISLAGGYIAFGVAQGSNAQTICGATNVADGNWHHIALTRESATGQMRIFIDGNLDSTGNGPTGDISYRNGRSTSYPNSDPYLVIGAEKHDAGSSYPSFSGFLDELHISTAVRYTSNFSPPSAPFTADAQTAALYHFDEGPAGACTGTITDDIGSSSGQCRHGGSAPAGPVYSSDTPFTPPDTTPPSVSSITLANPNPTSASNVNFTAIFSEAVTGVDMSDFTIAITGSISGADVTAVSGSGSVYTVTVNTGTGNGTLRLDVTDDDSILDTANNPLGGAGADNGNFTSGEVYDVVKSSDLLSPANGVSLLDRRPNFDWTDFAGASSYQLQVARNNTFTLGLVSATSLSSQYAWPIDLLPNTTHYWRVRAKVGAVYTAWSNTWSFTTANPPSIPVLVAPVNNALTTDYTPKLDWNNVTVPLGTTFDHYQLQVATDAAFTSIVLDKSDLVNLTDSEFTFPTDLTDNTTFYWRVRSFNSLGQYSSWSLTRTFRTALLPPTLTSPANGGIVSNPRPTFDWSDVASVTTYSIQVSRYSNFSILLINASAATSAYAPAVNLPLNVTFYWRVRSNGTNGPSMWSSTNTFIIQ